MKRNDAPRSTGRLATALFGAVAACSTPKTPAPAIGLEAVDGPAISLRDPTDPIGVSAAGTVVARLAGTDSSYRIIDSTGAVTVVGGGAGVGVWLARPDGGFHTMAPGAVGVVPVAADGTVEPTVALREPGVVRGVFGDSVDLMRLGADGFRVMRVAADGSGEREIVGTSAAAVRELIGVKATGSAAIPPDAALPSVTTGPSRVVIGNGNTYQLIVFDAAGQVVGRIARQLPRQGPTERQIDRELEQLRRAQQLTESYLRSLRGQLAQSRVPFFAPQQGARYDGAGRLWVVGYQADSAFADVFSDTTFVARFPLACPGFDGVWDLTGGWLAVACGQGETGAGGGVVKRYRITERR